MQNASPEQEFFDRLARIRTFAAKGQRALHKPILLLYALSRLKHGHAPAIRYVDAEILLSPLLQRLGPSGTRARVSDPFTRLERDGIWELKFAQRDLLLDANGNGKHAALHEHNVEAGFLPRYLSLLMADTALIDSSVFIIVREHVPPHIADDILRSVGWQT